MTSFVDTNVMVDLLLRRKPFVDDAMRIFYLAEVKRRRCPVAIAGHPHLQLPGRIANFTAILPQQNTTPIWQPSR